MSSSWIKHRLPHKAAEWVLGQCWQGPDHGEKYLIIYVEFEYADGSKLHVTNARKMDNCATEWVNVQGTKLLER